MSATITDFGPPAAQDDPNLLEYFHTTPQVTRLTASQDAIDSNFIVVSLPGAGKTALMRWFESNSNRFNAIIVRGADHRVSPSDESMNVDDHRTLLWAELATGCILETKKRFTLSGEATAGIRNFRKRRAFSRLQKFFTEDFQGLQILGTGFSIEPRDRKSYLAAIRDPAVRDDLADTLDKVAAAAQPMLIVDDPEYIVARGLNEPNSDNAILLGCLFSTLSHLNAAGIRVIVFVKEHLFRGMCETYVDSRHFEDKIQSLEWTEDDLLQLIKLRLHNRLQKEWSDVFSVSEPDFKSYLLPHLINGPRDLLDVCNSAIRQGAPIDRSKLDRALAQLSSKWRRELRKQFGARWPGFESFTDECVNVFREQLDPERMTMVEMTTALEDALTSDTPLRKMRSTPWIDDLVFDIYYALEMLYAAGCLGLYAGSKKRYPWAGRSAELFSFADAYFVSPGVPSR